MNNDHATSLTRYRAKMTEMLGDVYRARKEPVTLAEYDRLRVVREDRTLATSKEVITKGRKVISIDDVGVSGHVRDGKFHKSKPHVISAKEIIIAATEAAKRIKMRRELEVGA